MSNSHLIDLIDTASDRYGWQRRDKCNRRRVNAIVVQRDYASAKVSQFDSPECGTLYRAYVRGENIGGVTRFFDAPQSAIVYAEGWLDHAMQTHLVAAEQLPPVSRGQQTTSRGKR